MCEIDTRVHRPLTLIGLGPKRWRCTDVEFKRKILRDHFQNVDFRSAIACLNAVLESFDRSLRATYYVNLPKPAQRYTTSKV